MYGLSPQRTLASITASCRHVTCTQQFCVTSIAEPQAERFKKPGRGKTLTSSLSRSWRLPVRPIWDKFWSQTAIASVLVNEFWEVIAFADEGNGRRRRQTHAQLKACLFPAELECARSPINQVKLFHATAHAGRLRVDCLVLRICCRTLARGTMRPTVCRSAVKDMQPEQLEGPAIIYLARSDRT